MITVSKNQKQIHPSQVEKSSIKYGVWAYGADYRHDKNAFKLVFSYPHEKKWHFDDISGHHSDYNNHATCVQAIEHMISLGFAVCIPESKEELIKLLQDNLR